MCLAVDLSCSFHPYSHQCHTVHEWVTRNGFKFAAHKCKVIHFTAPRARIQRPPLSGLDKHLFQWRSQQSSLDCGGIRISPFKNTSMCWRQCKDALNLIRVVTHLKWGGNRNTSDAVLGHCSLQLDYGCIVYGTASNANLRHLDSIHNSGLRLALGTFCTSPVSTLYTEAKDAPLEEDH